MSDAVPVVLSVGGSIVVPKTGIDTVYLQELRRLIMSEIKRGRRFVIVVGGGATAREYQNAARQLVNLEPEDVDWLGIHATRLNGHLLRTLFRDVAHPRVIKDPTRAVRWREPLMVAAGWKPGWSTDYIAVRMAKKYGARRVINLTNTDAVYDKDPAKYPDARPFKVIAWKEFCAMVGNRWIPGANVPFDPIASRLAAKEKMEVVIADGKDLANLKAIMAGKSYRGTTIETLHQA